MRRLPPGYNPGRPRPRPIVGSGITGPRPGMSTPFGPRPGVQPLPSPNMQQPRPNIQFGVQPLPAAPGPLGGSVTQPTPWKGLEEDALRQQPAPGGYGGPLAESALRQQPAPGGIGEYVLRQKNAPGGLGGQINPGMSPSASSALDDLMKRFGQQPGMAQPLPTAPSFGGPQPQGGDRFVNMFRQQPAPMQPVPAMKKGGVVRGVRIALRGAKKAKIY